MAEGGRGHACRANTSCRRKLKTNIGRLSLSTSAACFAWAPQTRSKACARHCHTCRVPGSRFAAVSTSASCASFISSCSDMASSRLSSTKLLRPAARLWGTASCQVMGHSRVMGHSFMSGYGAQPHVRLWGTAGLWGTASCQVMGHSRVRVLDVFRMCSSSWIVFRMPPYDRQGRVVLGKWLVRQRQDAVN